MGSGATKYLGVALAAAAVSAVVSSLTFLVLGSNDPPPTQPPVIELTAIEAELRSLRRELERIANRPASLSEPSATTTAEGRSPVDAEPIDLAALHDAIEKLEEIANQAPSAQRIQMLAEMHTLPRLPENWIALDQLVSLGDAGWRDCGGGAPEPVLDLVSRTSSSRLGEHHRIQVEPGVFGISMGTPVLPGTQVEPGVFGISMGTPVLFAGAATGDTYCCGATAPCTWGRRWAANIAFSRARSR